MKKLLLIVLLLIVSCNTDEWKEKRAKAIAAVSGPVLSKVLTCADPVCVENFVYDKAVNSKLLKKTQHKSLLVKTLCPLVLKGAVIPAVQYGVSKMPEACGCTGSMVENASKFVIDEICSKL